MFNCVGFLSVILLLICWFVVSEDFYYYYYDDGDKHKVCPASSCGNIQNITHPFRLTNSPPDCGFSEFELSCENNITLLLNLFSTTYYVKEIDHYSIRVVDASLQKDNCSSLPRFSLSTSNFTQLYYTSHYSSREIVFVSCIDAVNSSDYVETAPCINDSSYSNRHSYVLLDNPHSSIPPPLHDFCRIEFVAMTSFFRGDKDYKNMSYAEINHDLLFGFLLYADSSLIFKSYIETLNSHYSNSTSIILLNHTIIRLLAYLAALPSLFILLQMAKYICGMIFLVVYLIYKYRRRHLSMFDTVEDYLRSQSNIVPISFSYYEIKRMTQNFKDKLGEGGFGSVYKGKLRSNIFVAVKVLGKSKANGQDFINEVATIGRIHHVNVVRLIGFCAESSRRALIYEFMPNGSLEKHIFPKNESSISLSCQQIYDISLGVGRGIQYLHTGCDIQILHFDIKPHNILLDEDFTPKVSDFGLARLYSTDDSIVSLTAARGTIGYMAPELFYKNLGGVSYKADVYSFGMLLMEMASKRKNVNAFADHSSQIYFPTWVYDQMNKGKGIEMGDATEEDRKIVTKMSIVALWCIQMRPADRPSMNRVMEMLEGEVEVLQMPPKPCLSQLETREEHFPTSITEGSSTSSSETISLV